MLSGVLAADIEKVWPVVLPLLQRAIDKSEHDYSAEDVFACLKSRDMQLWIWNDLHSIQACLITLIVNYPRKSICQLPYIGGKGMRHWLKCEPIIIAWAKQRHCTQLEGFARKGWLRVLPSWRPVWTTLRKDI